MISIPILKFDKTNNYLETQLFIQNHNKKLITDNISNFNNVSIKSSAETYLKNISENIQEIEKLHSYVNNINKEIYYLANLEIPQTQDFYIDEFSKLKDEIELLSQDFKVLEQKLTIDNNNFDKFIATNLLIKSPSNKLVITNNDIIEVLNKQILKDYNKLNIQSSSQDKISNIENALKDNDSLIISEKLNKIYLPYTITELKNTVKENESLKDVVNRKYILPFDKFIKNPSKSRFIESYTLLRNEGINIFQAFTYSFKLLSKRNLNPAIISACKTKRQLDTYLNCLNSNTLNYFDYFKIIYEVNPL